MIGTLKASQMRTKRAALREESMSSTPPRYIGWLATTPTLLPSIRPKPMTRFCAKYSCTSMNSPLSRSRSITSRTS